MQAIEPVIGHLIIILRNPCSMNVVRHTTSIYNISSTLILQMVTNAYGLISRVKGKNIIIGIASLEANNKI